MFVCLYVFPSRTSTFFPSNATDAPVFYYYNDKYAIYLLRIAFTLTRVVSYS